MLSFRKKPEQCYFLNENIQSLKLINILRREIIVNWSTKEFFQYCLKCNKALRVKVNQAHKLQF